MVETIHASKNPEIAPDRIGEAEASAQTVRGAQGRNITATRRNAPGAVVRPQDAFAALARACAMAEAPLTRSASVSASARITSLSPLTCAAPRHDLM